MELVVGLYATNCFGMFISIDRYRCSIMRLVLKILFWGTLVTLIIALVFYRPLYKTNTYTKQDEERALLILWSDIDVHQQELTNKEYKTLIENEMNFRFYIHKQKNMTIYKDAKGISSPLILLVVIDDEISGWEYCITLSDELMHIKYFTADERFVNFQVFKMLYESDNEYLHNIGVWYGLCHLENRITSNFSCKGYIVNYLKE